MPKRASGKAKSRTTIGVRLTVEEVAELDSFVEKMRLRFPAATRSSVMRTMLRKYLSSLDGKLS